MKSVLGKQFLTAIQARFAILSSGKYALPVRFVVQDQYVQCLVPTWSGIGDLLSELDAVLMVVTEESAANLRWLFIRGTATVITEPEWDLFELPPGTKMDLGDLYQVLRIKPKRIELADEQHGWGYRETADW